MTTAINNNNRRLYLVLDAEMGGIDLNYSLLTVYFRVVNDKFEYVDSLYLFLKPDDGHYVVSARGMEVNGINLVEHDKTAITYSDGRDILRKWLYSLSQLPNYARMTALGHGVGGDIRHVWDKLISREKWEAYVSYRNIDTSSIAEFLRDRGVIPPSYNIEEGVSGSLESLARFFNVEVEGQLHDAKTDALLTIGVYRKMID